MRCAVLGPERRLEVAADHQVPALMPGWALVSVIRAGICGTDLEMLKEYKSGFRGVLGHEFVGLVKEVAPAGDEAHAERAVKVGDRVVGEINVGCRACAVCRGEDHVAARNHCPARKCLGIWDLDGAFAEVLALPVRNLYRVPDCVSDEIAVFAEPLAAACRVLEQLCGTLCEGEGPQRVAVVGDGKLGLLVAAVLSERCRAGVEVVLVGKHPEHFELVSRGAPGPAVLSSAMATAPGDTAALAERANTFDVVVEATAAYSGLLVATQLARPLGTVVLKSTCSAKAPADAGIAARQLEAINEARNAAVVKELVLLGSRCGPFPVAMDLLRTSGYIRGVLAGLVDSTFQLEQIEVALARARTRGALKVQIVMS